MTNLSTQTAQSGTSSSSTSSEGSSPSGSSMNATLTHTSSQNALKAGIYSNRLLAHEDPHLLQECIEGYIKDFEITTTAGYQLAQQLAQVVLKLNRLENWQADFIEAHLAKKGTRFEFVNQLNLNMNHIEQLPFWYFNGCQKSRKEARQIYAAYKQLERLIANHSSDLVEKIQTVFPDLWHFVMGASDAYSNDHTFSEKLSEYSKQNDPKLQLVDLKNYMLKHCQYHISWANSEDRYDTVLRGLRAQAQMDLFTNLNLQRGETSLHRRKTDLLAQLLQLKREAQSLKIIELENTAPSASTAPLAGIITFHENGSPAETATKSKGANA